MKKLDEFGDDYRSAKIKSILEEEERIRSLKQATEASVTIPVKKSFKKKMKGGYIFEMKVIIVCLK